VRTTYEGITLTVGIPHKIQGHALACVAVDVEAHFLLSLKGNCQWSAVRRRSAVVLNDALRNVAKRKVVNIWRQSMEGAIYFSAQKKELLGGPLHKGHDRRWRVEEKKLTREITNTVSS